MSNNKAIWRCWKRWGAIFIAIVAFVTGPWHSYGQPPAAIPARDQPAPSLHMLASSEQAIVLELRVPAWQVNTRELDQIQLDEIEVPGFSYLSEAGAPRLPVRYVTLGIPPGAEPQVQVLKAEGLHVETGYRLAANPSLSLDPDLTAPPSLAGLTGPPPLPPLQPARGDAFYPAELAQVVEVGRLRSQRFVQLRLSPFQYHPEKQELRVYERLQLAVKFNSPTSKVEGAPVDEGPFEPILRTLLFNYTEAQAWRIPPGAAAQVEPSTFYTGIRFRIEVKEAGIYQLTRNMLLIPGIYDFPLSTFQLFEDFNLDPSSEVALEIVDNNGNDRLDFDDAIRFYGRGPDETEARYTDRRVYWLVMGRETGRRMTTRLATPGSGTIAPDFPTTVHREENHIYWSDLPEKGGSDAHWYWDYLNHVDPGAPLERDYTVATPGLSSISHEVTVRAKAVGFSSDPDVNPDHWTRLSVNGNLITSAIWDGQEGVIIGGTISSSSLSAGGNTVRVRIDLLPATKADALFVDWFEVDYRRSFQAQNDRLFFTRPAGYSEYQITGFSSSNVGVYDITDPRHPVRLTGVQKPAPGTLRFGDATPSVDSYIALVLQPPAVRTPEKVVQVDAGVDLRDPANGADYLIITHADFTAAAARLAAYRAAEFTTKVIQVQDIYNQFGNGVLDPEAIRDFLAYTVDNWSPRPQYVVLIGDGSYDYRNYLGTSPPNYVPPYQAMVDPWLGETASENHYAAVAGPDIIPDLFVGRFPVNTLDEANAIVDKIIAYEANPGTQTLQSSGGALFVADDYDPTRNAGNFPEIVDSIVSDTLPQNYPVYKVYYQVTHSTVGGVKSAIISHINQGRQFVNYVGHSGVSQWGDEEGFFTSADVDSLSNAGRYPVILGMTCLEGAFQDVAQDAVAERMVRTANKGAVASWSATGLGVATGHDTLHRGFYDALFRGGVRRLGPAIMTGKMELYKTGANLDLIHTFGLLGDPALDTGIEAVCASPQADVTEDGTVDVEDLTTLALLWRQSRGAPYDQDGNNFINVIDLMRVAAAWGAAGSGCGG